jgi:hypothetical protein
MEEGKLAKLNKLLKAQIDRNDAMEFQLNDFKQKQSHLLAVLKSMG